MFYPERDPRAHSLVGTNIQVLNCSNPCKKIQMEFLHTQKLGSMLLEIVCLWSSRSSTICKMNHKFGLTSLLLETCRLPTRHRSQSTASHLQAHLLELTHILWTGPVYSLADNRSKHNFPKPFWIPPLMFVYNSVPHTAVPTIFSESDPALITLGSHTTARGERFKHAILFHCKKKSR